MIRGVQENNFQLYTLTENKLVFKDKFFPSTTKNQPSLFFSKNSKKTILSTKKLKTHPIKNIFQQRQEIKKFLQTKPSQNRQKHAETELKVVGRSESNENIKNSVRYRRSFSEETNKTLKTSVPLIKNIGILCKTDTNYKKITESTLRVKGNRRIVPISNRKLDLCDFEDTEDCVIIKSRYY